MKTITFTELARGHAQMRSVCRWTILSLLLMLTGVTGLKSQNTCSMACANANIGIAEDCIAYVSPLSVAKVNQTGCDTSTWIIYIRETMNGPVIATGTIANPAQLNGNQYLNRILVAEVFDGASGNRCWAFIELEDKTAPRVECRDITIECDEILSYKPVATDNCSISSLIRINETRRNANCTRRNGIAVVNNGFGFWEAFGSTDFQNAAFNDLFGIGQWDKFDYSVSANNIFNNQYGFVYLDGGNENANELSTFLQMNRSLIESWVAGGGALFLNAAPNEGGNIDFGFGGFVLRYEPPFTWIEDGAAVDVSHPIFQGPLTPATGPFTGNYFAHAIICPPGAPAQVLMRDLSGNNDLLVELRHGQGLVFFGGLTTPNFHAPSPAADNFRRNIYHYLYNNRNEFARGLTSIINQTWVAVDHVGNRDTCSVRISVRRPDLARIECPVDEISLRCNGDWKRDQRGNPHPEETGYPSYNGTELNPWFASVYCNLLVHYEDLHIPGLCQGERKIMRQWRVSEWYCGEDFDVVCNQLIILKDQEGPQITCPANREVSTGDHHCATQQFIERPVLSDNCSPVQTLSVDLSFGLQFFRDFRGGLVNGFEVGQNVLTFTAYDDCGNSSSCTQIITVRDLIVPIAICKTYTVASLGSDGTARVPWPSFDDGSYDNCALDRFEVRRMNPHPCDPDPQYNNYVTVCCQDVGTPVMVIMRVWDRSGNSNSCMVELEVQDKLPAYILCPPDLSVNCGFDLGDLSVFGKVANLIIGERRDSIFINGVFSGIDGFAFDNCDVTITQTSDIDLTNCGAGRVTRTFTAVGAGNNRVAECQQRIQVINDVNFLPQTIIWPCDIAISNFCTTNPAQDLTPNVLSTLTQGVSIVRCPNNRQLNQFYDRPRFQDNECTKVGVSFKDHVFTFQDSACYKIVREWKLVDWCAMEQNPGLPLSSYTYSYVQVIKIKNTVAPVITCAAPVEVCSYQTNCSVGEVLTVSATATDDCTREEDLFWRWEYFENNGNIVTRTGNSSSLTQNFPVGLHRVRFVVEDRCGNTAACSMTVRVRDCKQPTPICHHLVIDLMITGSVSINARNFNAGSNDNCTPQADLIYRIERRPFATAGSVPPSGAGSSAVFTCDDLGLNDVRIWVGDEDGNWDYCETTLLVQNNVGAQCLGTSGGILAGILFTENTDAVEHANVHLHGQYNGMYTTGNQGRFNFQNVPFGSSFSVRPERLDNPVNGVTTLDILLIQRHILGIDYLDSPYKIIAADVNSSGHVTGADLVEMRKLILGSIDNYTHAPSWKFVPKDYRFFDANNPLAEQFPQKVDIQHFDGQIPNLEFVAIKMGDVNTSVKANSNLNAGESRNNKKMILSLDDLSILPGNSYLLAFKARESYSLLGYQFTLGLDPAIFDIENIIPGVLNVTPEHFGMRHLNRGLLSTSWNANQAIEVNAGDVLFTLEVRANRDGKLSQLININAAITPVQAYLANDEGTIADIELDFDASLNEKASGFELFQNRPNPFSQGTIIGFQLPEAQQATITLYDMTGKRIHFIDGQFNSGYNEVSFEAADFNGIQGVIYYELSTMNARAVKKMVRVQ